MKVIRKSHIIGKAIDKSSTQMTVYSESKTSTILKENGIENNIVQK